MKRTPRLMIIASLLATLAVVLFWFGPSRSRTAHAEEAAETGEAAPVEPDMHEFMEYVFQPAYLRLKAQMAAEPEDNQGWKAIKSDSLILAEGGNLLLIRQAEEDAKDWVRHSVRVRDLGGHMYRAAKAKDFKATTEHYEAMLTNCNACHQQFADGKYQLKP